MARDRSKNNSNAAAVFAQGSQPPGFVAAPGKRSNRIIRIFGVFTIAAAVIVATASFWIMTGASNIEPTPKVWTAIWITNAVLIVLVIALVLTEIVMLFQARMKHQAGARLRVRLVVLFALVATVPAFIVAIFAAITLNQGLDHWFSERTRDIVESSRQVARSYLLEHAQVLRDDVIWVATELCDQPRALPETAYLLGHHPLASLHLAGFARRLDLDAGPDQRSGGPARGSGFHHGRCQGGGADLALSGRHQHGRRFGQASRL